MISKLKRFDKSFVRTVALGGLLLPATIAVATSSFAQSAPQTADANIASKSSSPDRTGPNAKKAAIEPSSQTAAKQDGSAASTDAAAKDAAQNPLANTISVPIQNNTYYSVGPDKGAVNAMIVEPVIPIKLNKNWNLITRTIVPILRAPAMGPVGDSIWGLGNMQPQFYFSPSHPGPGKIIWGIGPQLYLPTATDDRLGVNKFGGGVAGVIVTSRGHFMFGAIINNTWTGQNDRHQRVNQFTLNPFVFYNLRKGWYVLSSPLMTADWTAQPGEKWTVPVGGGVGRIFKVGAQPLNARVQFWKDVEKPAFGPSWTMQAQIQFLFIRKPKTSTH